jgi:hypothetical protein
MTLYGRFWVTPEGPYEADLAAGELRKDRRLVRLQEQPF